MKRKIAIIFGVSGQDGYYLDHLLQQQNIEVIGVKRDTKKELNIDDNKTFIEFIIKKYQPDYLFHLAAVSSTAHQFVFEHQQTICDDVLYILEATKVHSPATKVFISGSALQFKNDNVPIKETATFEGKDFYSVCRIYSAYAARYYRSLGLNIYVGYFFNHDSALRTDKHITKKIVELLKSNLAGQHTTLELGDIKAEKEWGFAGDIANAIWILVNQDTVHEAVIGTGKAYSIEHWLNICFADSGLDWKDYIIPNDKYRSPYKVLVSDPSTIMSLGWQPQVSIEKLAYLMINNIIHEG